MKLSLQEKYLCFVTQHLTINLAGQYLNLLSELRNKIFGQNYQPTDLVEIEVDKTEVLAIYFEVGNKPEYFVSAINREMKTLLYSQFSNKMGDYQILLSNLGLSELTQSDINSLSPSDQIIAYEGQDVLWLIDQITKRDQTADVQLEGLIQVGRNLLTI